jgi:hypothetical protein
MSDTEDRIRRSAARIDAYLAERERELAAEQEADDRHQALQDADERRALQRRFDRIFEPYGEACPAAVADERPSAYHRRLLHMVQSRLSPGDERKLHRADGVEIGTVGEIAKVSIDELTRTARAAMSPLFEQAAAMQAKEPCLSSIKPGTLAERYEVNPATGAKTTKFYGESFIREFSAPPMRVVRIRNPRTGEILMGEPFPKGPAGGGLWDK